MREEYDFIDGQRGKLHRPGQHLIPPVHLEPDVLAYLAARAKDSGTTLNSLVNQLLKRDIEKNKVGS